MTDMDMCVNKFSHHSFQWLVMYLVPIDFLHEYKWYFTTAKQHQTIFSNISLKMIEIFHSTKLPVIIHHCRLNHGAINFSGSNTLSMVSFLSILGKQLGDAIYALFIIVIIQRIS